MDANAKLFQAIFECDQSAILAAISSGADVWALDSTGRDAFDIARESAGEDIFNFLIVAVAQLESKIQEDELIPLTKNNLKKTEPEGATRGSSTQLKPVDQELLVAIKEVLDERARSRLSDDISSSELENPNTFQKPSAFLDDESLVFNFLKPSLVPDLDLDFIFESCLEQYALLDQHAKNIVDEYLCHHGADIAIFKGNAIDDNQFSNGSSSRFNDREFVAECLTGSFDPSVSDLFEYLSDIENSIPSSQLELTLALFVDLAKQAHDFDDSQRY